MLPLLLALLVVTAVQLVVGTRGMHLLDAASIASVHAAGGSGAPSAPNDLNTAARQLADMLNRARAEAGLPPLEWDDRLAQAATQHTELMMQHGKLSHDFPGELPLRQRLAASTLRLDRSGENVAYDPTLQGIHEGFVHSKPHRENMLSPQYNAVGIGVAMRDGMFYVTEDFAHRLPEMSDAQVSRMIHDRFAELRRSAGVPLLPKVEDARVRDLACAMARTELLNTGAALELRGARYAVAYTATEPDKLPSDVLRLGGVRDVNRYGLGVCFARTAKYPSGVYWVVMVLFSPQRG